MGNHYQIELHLGVRISISTFSSFFPLIRMALITSEVEHLYSLLFFIERILII